MKIKRRSLFQICVALLCGSHRELHADKPEQPPTKVGNEWIEIIKRTPPLRISELDEVTIRHRMLLKLVRRRGSLINWRVKLLLVIALISPTTAAPAAPPEQLKPADVWNPNVDAYIDELFGQLTPDDLKAVIRSSEVPGAWWSLPRAQQQRIHEWASRNTLGGIGGPNG